jgi:hypothetical protein
MLSVSPPRHPGERRDPFCLFRVALQKIKMDSGFRRNDGEGCFRRNDGGAAFAAMTARAAFAAVTVSRSLGVT